MSSSLSTIVPHVNVVKQIASINTVLSEITKIWISGPRRRPPNPHIVGKLRARRVQPARLSGGVAASKANKPLRKSGFGCFVFVQNADVLPKIMTFEGNDNICFLIHTYLKS